VNGNRNTVLQRVIPRTGEPLPVVGLGTWQTFDVARQDYSSRSRVLERFVELGGRLIDSSPMYGRSEVVVGDLASDLHLDKPLFMATKVWTTGAREGIAQMEDSFRKLRVTRMDLLQVHNLVDVETHLATLLRWKGEGKVRYVGVTHYTVESHRLLERFLQRGEVDFVQFNYSLAVRNAETHLLPMAAEYGVATLINRPFENGDIFRAAQHKPLPAIASELQCHSWAQLFVKYVIAHPAVTCIIPATSRVDHVEENMNAACEPVPNEDMRRAIARAWDA
jgi:diketogulonate reductase-like aldo/keto reductase